MAMYKQPCIHCGALVERDSHYCPKCASRTPFGFQCPYCLKSITRSDTVCPGCGRGVLTTCFYCGQQTFIGSERCDACGRWLMICCENKRCKEFQYFTITKCTACGKKIKKAIKQIEEMKRGAMQNAASIHTQLPR